MATSDLVFPDEAENAVVPRGDLGGADGVDVTTDRRLTRLRGQRRRKRPRGVRHCGYAAGELVRGGLRPARDGGPTAICPGLSALASARRAERRRLASSTANGCGRARCSPNSTAPPRRSSSASARCSTCSAACPGSLPAPALGPMPSRVSTPRSSTPARPRRVCGFWRSTRSGPVVGRTNGWASLTRR